MFKEDKKEENQCHSPDKKTGIISRGYETSVR